MQNNVYRNGRGSSFSKSFRETKLSRSHDQQYKMGWMKINRKLTRKKKISSLLLSSIYMYSIFNWREQDATTELPINTLRPRQNFQYICLNQNARISIKISLKFVRKGSIYNNPALVQIMAWHRTGDKPLSELMMVRLPMHICVSLPQWMTWYWWLSVEKRTEIHCLCIAITSFLHCLINLKIGRKAGRIFLNRITIYKGSNTSSFCSKIYTIKF